MLVDAIEQLRTADAQLNACDPVPFPLPINGLEAVIAGAVTALGRGDWWVPGLRERVGAVLRDTPVDRLVDGTRGAKPYKVAPPSASTALRALYAVGIATANPERTTLVHLGIGATSDGAFHEALNLAKLRDANVIFLVARHPLDGDAPLGTQLATTPAALATAFGIHAEQIDGNSARDVFHAVKAAKDRQGPTLIQADLTPGEDLLSRAQTEAAEA